MDRRQFLSRPPLQPGGHAQRLDAALAHEQRRQGVPPGGRAGGARDGARLQGPPVGLQRPEPGADDRGGRRRPRAHLRHQQAARAHQRALARPAPAQRHGRRRRPDPARIPPGKTFVYEFVARRPGTFMYHPHADEMVQMAMGMMGFWVTHPKDQAPADRRGRPRLLLPAQRLRHRSRQLHARRS
jgi:hypothetical protein